MVHDEVYVMVCCMVFANVMAYSVLYGIVCDMVYGYVMACCIV